MAIGSFMGQVFTVSDRRILTPNNLKGGAGSDWATHEVVGGKPRSEWLGPKLRNYTFDLLLRTSDGINPRDVLERLRTAAETQSTDWFIVGNRPISQNPFKITDLSEEWDTVLVGGWLAECKVTLTIEEYV